MPVSRSAAAAQRLPVGPPPQPAQPRRNNPAFTPAVPFTFPQTLHKPAGAPAGVGGYAFAPSDNRTGYACNSRTSDESTPASGVAALDVTHDGGATWQALHTGPLAPTGCARVFVDAADARDVFIGIWAPWSTGGQTTEQLYRSGDGGSTWTALPTPAAQSGVYADPSSLAVLAISPDATVVALSQSTFSGPFTLRATDTIPHWRPLATVDGPNMTIETMWTGAATRVWSGEDRAGEGQHLQYVDVL